MVLSWSITVRVVRVLVRVSKGRAWLVEVEHGTQVVHVLAYVARQRNHDPLLNEYK